MGRPWREEYQGGIYHVIARGNNKEYIFKESIDKGCFIKQLKEYSSIMGYAVYAYVLMDNHYHILIQTMDKKLQEIMHQINNKYSKYFNHKYERVGHVFQGRYKAVRVQDERYLLKLVRYIHQNPVRAGMVSRAELYRWSSDVYYRKDIKSFVNINVPLEMLDKNKEKAIEKYKEFMSEHEKEQLSKLNTIGDEAYIIMCLSRRETKRRKALDEILKEVVENEKEYDLIKSGSRKRNLTAYKLKYAKAAIEEKHTFTEIGRYIGMTDSGIKYMLDRYDKITG
ncbi:MAG: transposase [Bacillota bacterium]